jgi:hypothetical protein
MANNRGGEDYLDKALDQAEKFAGKKVQCSPHPRTLRHAYIAPSIYKNNSGLTFHALAVRPPRRLGKVQEAKREDHGQAALDVREGYGQEGAGEVLQLIARNECEGNGESDDDGRPLNRAAEQCSDCVKTAKNGRRIRDAFLIELLRFEIPLLLGLN